MKKIGIIKRLGIVFVIILAIVFYFYTHGKVYEFIHPEEFIRGSYLFAFIVGSIQSGFLALILYVPLIFVLYGIIWPIIKCTINYISGKEIFLEENHMSLHDEF